MNFRNFIDEFNTKLNKKSWDDFHTYVANVLTYYSVPLDNVFFVNTPGFIVFISELDKSIIQKPASEYSNLVTRKVIFEKCKQSKKFNCYYHRKGISGDKIVTLPLTVMSYRLNWNESSYGTDYDLMKSLKSFIETKSHLPLFMYVDDSFFNTIEQTKIIRIAILDTSAI